MPARWEVVTWGDDCDARWPGLSPIAPIGHTHHSPFPTVLNMKAIPQEILEEVVVRKFSIFNPTSVPDKYLDMMRQRGHDVVTTSRHADALAMMRGQSFDALVMDCAQDAVDILNFTAKGAWLATIAGCFSLTSGEMSRNRLGRIHPCADDVGR